MEERMEEPYTEGLAPRGDPEPCGWLREGPVEASAGAGVGRAIEPRNEHVPSADGVGLSGRPHGWVRYCECPTDSARSKTPSMYRTFMHENREIPRPPVASVASGRVGKA